MTTPATSPRKPECQLTGINGNVFSIIGAVGRALRMDGQRDREKEWRTAAMACRSYDAVLQLLHDYVEAS